MVLWEKCFAEGIKRKARQRGIALKTTFPSIHGRNRGADHDEAKKKGWLA
jgi:hypothetical protein